MSLSFEILDRCFLPALAFGMVSQAVFTIFSLGSLLIGSHSTPKALSVVMSRPEEAPGFPYFHFISGLFYGFVAGMCFMGYLTWKYILKPKPPPVVHTNKGKSGSRSPSSKSSHPKIKNALVQGPVTYNRPPHYKSKEYEPLAEKHWGAWWY